MRQDSVSVSRFYSSRLGQAAGEVLAGRVVDLWGHSRGLSMLGYGFARPLLAPFAGEASRIVAAVPELAGHVLWDACGRGNCTVMVPELRLPFADGLFDRAVLLHALEETVDPRQLCREIWRVMAPEGRIIIAATNRRGVWASAERTPFGHGRPWTKRQLATLLSDCAFQVTASTHALFMPPIGHGVIASGADVWERVGHFAAPGLGGVVLVEAVKRLYIRPGSGAVAPVTYAEKSRRPVGALPRE